MATWTSSRLNSSKLWSRSRGRALQIFMHEARQATIPVGTAVVGKRSSMSSLAAVFTAAGFWPRALALSHGSVIGLLGSYCLCTVNELHTKCSHFSTLSEFPPLQGPWSDAFCKASCA